MKTLLLVCLFACSGILSLAQSITIGNGTDRSSSPWQPKADYSYNQTIYLASEMATSGSISAIRFYFDSTSLSSSNKVTVFVGHTTKSSFANTTDWEPLSGLNKVFDNTLPLTTLPGWVTITFTTPFAYNGTDNLVVAIDENQPGHETKGGFYSMNYTGNRSLSVTSNSNIDSTNPSAGTLSSYAANVRIVGLSGPCNEAGNFSYSYAVTTGTNVTIKWKDAATGTTPTAYQYEVRNQDTLLPGSSNAYASGTTTTNSVTYYVNSGDDYRLYVRPVCGTGVYGPWVHYSGGDCTVYDVPYTVDFEGSYSMPPCTKAYLGTQDYSGINWGVSTNVGSNKLKYCSGIDPADAYFETPFILIEKDSTYTFSYNWNGNTDDYFYSNMWGRIPSWGSGTQELENTYPSKTYTKIQFHAFTAGGLGGCLYIDNISVKKTTCGKPKNVQLTGLTTTTARLQWQSPSLGVVANYSITYNGIRINSIMDTAIVLTGLTPGSVYYYGIRTMCSAGDSSISLNGSFTTPCLQVSVPYNEDFETSYIPNVPTCTQTEKMGTEKMESINAYAGFTGKVLYHFGSSTDAGAWFYTRGINMVTGTSYRLTFKYESTPGYSSKIDVKSGSSPLSSAMINSIASFTANSSSSKTVTFIFTPTVTGVSYIGFYVKALSSTSSSVVIDDISVTKYNLLNVSVFLDKNSNTVQDVGEPYFDDANIVTIKTRVDTIITHTSSGQCRVDIDTGKYITTVGPYRQNWRCVKRAQPYNIATFLNLDTAVFALQPIAGKRDLAVSIFANSPARPGFNITYQVICKNRGTDTVVNYVLKFVKPHLLNFISAGIPPSSIIADTLIWNLSNLYPDAWQSIALSFAIPAHPVINTGDYLFASANVSSGVTDLYPQDNNAYHYQIVTGSYDPNDKTERHGGSIKLSDILNDEYLQYTIRFQNTGNDTAFNIYVRDTLSPLLDYSSLEMVSASANYKLVINNGYKLLWTFNDIQLVDSNTNEPASHGYIVYRVKPKPTVSIGNIITNRASIRFDYNLPVKTNTDSCTVVSNVFPLNLLSFTAWKKDKTNVLNWTTAKEVNFDKFEIERSGDSRGFSKIGIVKNNFVGGGVGNYGYTDNAPLSSKNYYRLKILDKEGQFTYSPVRTIDNSSTFSVTIQPNPSKNDFTMLIHGKLNAPVQIRITDVNGKVVGQLTNKAEQNVSFGSDWLPGIYLIEARHGDEKQTVKAVKIK